MTAPSWLGLALLVLAAPAYAQEAAPSPPGDLPVPHMADMDMSAMESALGPYAMARDGSGTSWQPDASKHEGADVEKDGWMVMAHGVITGVYDDQSGARGGRKAFTEGMLMGMAQRSIGEGDALVLRLMLSPDPFMGKGGYPLLLGTGETADGRTPLIDRQHPHNLVMEASAAVSHQIGVHSSVYLYAGLPGEPALGPPAFMHRQSGVDDPEAPITHHWLDSTHITNGVITAGWAQGGFKVEASVFTGREPDQRRFDINAPRLDSFAARVSWNPTPNLSFQTSWGRLTSPEQLQPKVNEDRWTASALYVTPVGREGSWSTTAAIGIKRGSHGQTLDGFLFENAIKLSEAWTFFGRAEALQNNELLENDLQPPPFPQAATAYWVGKVGLGAIHERRISKHLKFGLGALYDCVFTPAPLRTVYGNEPHGAMIFVRLKVG